MRLPHHPLAPTTGSILFGLLAAALGCGPDPVPAGGGGGDSTSASTSTGTTSSASSTSGPAGGATTTSSGGSGTGGDASSGGGGATSAGGGGAGTGTGGSGPGAGGGGSGPGTGTGGSGGAATTTGSGGAGGAEVPCAGDPNDTPCAGGICCGGACIAANDDANCHACGNTCGALESCGATDCELDCAGGLTECNGECVDLVDDPANCGACGRDCGGTNCSLGACQAQLIFQDGTAAIGGIAVGPDAVYIGMTASGTSGTALVRYTPSSLSTASLLTASRINGGVILDGTLLTLAGYASSGAGMQRCDPANCQGTLTNPPLIVNYFHGNSPRFERGGGYVYGKSYTTDLLNFTIQQCSANQCTAIVTLPSAGFGMAASDTRLFWNNVNDIVTRPIAPPDQQPLDQIYRSGLSGSAGSYRLLATATRLYVWEPGAGRITSGNMAATPGAVTTEAVGVPDLVDLALRDGTLYWLRATPSLVVEACEVGSCSSTRRVLGTLPANNIFMSMVVDATHLYLASERDPGQGNTFGRLYRVPR